MELAQLTTFCWEKSLMLIIMIDDDEFSNFKPYGIYIVLSASIIAIIADT